MGTDDLGRDIYSGVVYGARVSLTIGVLSGLVSTVIGILVGAISGFHSGMLDEILMRFTEIFQVFPAFILALVFVAIFGPSLTNVIIALGIVGWPSTARLVRAEFLKLKEADFAVAARALGASKIDLIFSEILPNALPVAIVNTSFQVADAILNEAGLSFLGLSDPSLMSWGRILGNSVPYLRIAWWMSVFPGLLILVTVASMNLIGDGFNDVLNPKLRER
jgi:peptide/nickel transport system permease protein